MYRILRILTAICLQNWQNVKKNPYQFVLLMLSSFLQILKVARNTPLIVPTYTGPGTLNVTLFSIVFECLIFATLRFYYNIKQPKKTCFIWVFPLPASYTERVTLFSTISQHSRNKNVPFNIYLILGSNSEKLPLFFTWNKCSFLPLCQALCPLPEKWWGMEKEIREGNTCEHGN